MFKISIQRRKSLVNTHLKKNIAKINTITFMHTKSEFLSVCILFLVVYLKMSKNKVEFTTLKNLRCKKIYTIFINTKKTASVFACKNGICLQKVCLKRILEV